MVGRVRPDAQEIEEFIWYFLAAGTESGQAGLSQEVALRFRLDGDVPLMLWLQECAQALVVEALAALR
jgi:hypothetical protein